MLPQAYSRERDKVSYTEYNEGLVERLAMGNTRDRTFLIISFPLHSRRRIALFFFLRLSTQPFRSSTLPSYSYSS